MEPIKPMQPMKPLDFGTAWWPEDLGQPDSSGSANDLRFAFFGAQHRLAVSRDGKVTVYDTGEHEIGGVSVEDGTIRFTGQNGPVELGQLKPAD